MSAKLFNQLERISKGPLGWRSELESLGDFSYDNKNFALCFASSNPARIETAKQFIEQRREAAQRVLEFPVLEIPVASNPTTRLLLKDGFDVERILWDEQDTTHVYFTLNVVDTKPMKFQRVDPPKVISASIQHLMGTYAASQYAEREPLKSCERQLTDQQKQQLACAICVKDFLGPRMMKIDMVEVRKVLSSAQAILLDPPECLRSPATFSCASKKILYDANNFRELSPASAEDTANNASARVVTTCGVFIDGSLLIPAGSRIQKDTDNMTITVTPPDSDFIEEDFGEVSSGYLLTRALEAQGVYNCRGMRDTSNGEFSGTLYLPSTAEADRFVTVPTTVGGRPLEKSKMKPDITKTGLSIPVSMSFQQAKRLKSYFAERLEELKKLMGETMKVNLALEPGFGQFMVRIKGNNRAAMEEIGEYIKEFLIKGVVISPQEEASECEDLGFEYNQLLILRMKSKDVNEVENKLRARSAECAVAVSGTGNDTRIYCVGRGQEEVAQEVRTIIHNHRTRVGMLVARQTLQKVDEIAVRHRCQAFKATGISGGVRILGIAEKILLVDQELKKLEATPCAVCRENQIVQFTISCGSDHSVCKECIALMVNHAVSNNQFPLTCPGCATRTPLRLHDVKDVVGLTGLKESDLAQPAMRAYIAKHPELARHCPTTDCPGVIPKKRGFFKCTECRHTTCTDCENSNHVDKEMSCENAKNHVLTETEWKTKQYLDAMKACPRCALKVEKNTGCNAIRCICGAGFCWLCLQDCGTDSQAHHHFGVPGTPCYAKLFDGVYEDEVIDM